jgi:hypothetical protein
MVTKDNGTFYTGYRPELKVYRVDSKPFNLSYAEWFEKWWLWISSKPKSDHPMLDKDDKKAIVSFGNQSDKRVIFLASAANHFATTNYGFSTPSGSADRKGTIAKNKAILIPLIYSLHDVRSGGRNTLIEESLAGLADTDLSLTVDGIPFDGILGPPLSEFKITAGPFNASYNPQSPFISGSLKYTAGTGLESVISGYVVILAPLPADGKEHTIHFVVNSKGNPKNKQRNPALFKNVKYTLKAKK